mgnify:FL=1
MNWTTKDVHTLVEMYRSGAKVEEIAAVLGRTPNVIYAEAYYLRRAGVDIPLRCRRCWTPEHDETLINLRQAGMTLTEIADALDIALSTVETHSAMLVRQGRLPRTDTRRKRGQKRWEI